MKDKTYTQADLTCISRRWHFKMDWCKKNGLAPANAEDWNRAEAAWIAFESKTT
jgi:hypothetical protein